MSTYEQSLKQELARHFELSSLLYSLIKARVQSTAENVVAAHPKDQQYLDSAKMGCYEAWVSNLVMKLPTKEIEWMIKSLEKSNSLEKDVDKECE